MNSSKFIAQKYKMNRQLILKKRPVGLPDKDTWSLEENPIIKPQVGEVLIEHYYI